MNMIMRFSSFFCKFTKHKDSNEDIWADYCPACGSTDLNHTCVVVVGKPSTCDKCGKPKPECVCLPSMSRCPICDLYYCECFYFCDECGNTPCICGSSGGNGSSDDGPSFGGGVSGDGGSSSGGGSGSGGDSGGSSGDDSEDNDNLYDEKIISCKTLQEVRDNIPPRLKEKGIDLGNIIIVESQECANNASANYANNWIQICPVHFYGRPIIDQMSIIYHEYHHLTNDVVRCNDWRPYIQYLENAYIYETPSETIMAIYRKRFEENYYFDKSIGVIVDMSFDEYILSKCNSIEIIFPVERYQNEIAAYQAEIEFFPVVSNEYNEERQYMLWRNQQALLCSVKNYNN